MVEGQPVVWSETVLADCKAVFARRITFVLPPAVLGKLLGQTQHVLVAVRFGQHRSGGDVGILAVAFDDAAVRQFEPGPEAVSYTHLDVYKRQDRHTPTMTEQIIAQRLGIALRQVQGTVRLLRDGATIPFISRYRKRCV